ncbi:unnamed protein product [Rhizophagus irregularis]|nr:unnamed protein product [Rhizophagus irregularis]
MPGKQISKANRERIISAYFTVRRYLHDEGFGSYSAKKKPRLTEKHRTDRLKWCKDKKNWAEEWKQVLWSDESRFALFQSDGRARVWRSPRETYNKDCIQSSVKFGGGLVIFWGVSVGMGLTFDRDGREYGF